MIFVLLASVYLISIANGDVLSWKHLSVTFPKFNTLPMEEKIAKKEGWKLIADDCADTSTPFLGKRYMLGDEHTTILIYDNNGQIAGFQMSYKSSLKVGNYGKYASMYRLIGDYYYLTAYFTDPGNVCHAFNVRPKGFVGDKLVFMTGVEEYMTVPKLESDLKETNWTLGKCFSYMGTHYWNDISNDMDCDDLFPAFILYNKDHELVAWGFVSDVNLTGGRVEHPPAWLLGLFFQEATLPKCLKKLAHRSTQHVYFTKVGWLTHTCVIGGKILG